jgi:hypothetical protein
MKRNAPWLLGLALMAALIAAGCGGGGGDSGDGSTTTGLLSKDEFIKQADQICSEGDAATQTEFQRAFPNQQSPPTGDQIAQVARIAGQGVKDEITKIRALGAPAGDEAAVNSFLDAADSGADQIIAHPEQLQSSGQEPNSDIAKADQEARAYGLQVCGQSNRSG